MNSIQPYLAILAASLTINLSSCRVLSTDNQASLPTIPTLSDRGVAPVHAQPPHLLPVRKIERSPVKTVTVNLYITDTQCQALIPEPVDLPIQNSLEVAIAKVLEEQDSGDFNLTYRLILDRDSGVATLDLRIPSNSQRSLTSLSSCEQLGLFGGLRQTLTRNPIWKIQGVRFTEQGEDIWL